MAAARAETVLNRGNGAEPDSLDPAQAGSAMETNILGDIMVGLTTLDAAARPIPGNHHSRGRRFSAPGETPKLFLFGPFIFYPTLK